MEVVYRCCCGIDVHKKLIVACLNEGGRQELREFGTATSEIRAMANWLIESGCEMIAMVPWKVRGYIGSRYTISLNSWIWMP